MGSFSHKDLRFDSHGEKCGAELFLPEGPGPHPAVILCHGLGATREMGMSPYAEAFAGAGIAALTFTYRFFGDSGGQPRQLLDVGKQREDIAAAIDFVKGLVEVDADRIALFGSSFGGGHVIVVGAERDDIRAVVAQCPFTDGRASGMTLGPVGTAKVGARAFADGVARALGKGPIYSQLVGERGAAAMMTAPDVIEGYTALVPEGHDVDLRVAGRIGIDILFERPGKALAKIKCPTLVCGCTRDTVAPFKPTAKFAAAGGANVELKSYDFGHFDIYVGAGFDQVATDQTEFLVRTLNP
jgi:dienelactone hydrolase